MDKSENLTAHSARGYPDAEVKRFDTELQKLRNETVALSLDLTHLAGHLTNPRARTFANEGAGRRLPLVARSAENIYRIYPPGRTSFLTRDECSDIAINLHAFAINVYGLFDNIAWVCVLEAGQTLSPMKIGLFKAECQSFVPAVLKTYLAQPTTTNWFNTYGKVYRDSTAHRIAPYLPSRAYTPEEGARWQELHKQSHQQLFGAAEAMVNDRALGHRMLDAHDTLEQEKEKLGSNSLLFALSLTGADATPPVYLHPQLLCDWGLANELVRTFAKALRQDRGWSEPIIPNVQVS